jgi:hypothetical protein
MTKPLKTEAKMKILREEAPDLADWVTKKGIAVNEAFAALQCRKGKARAQLAKQRPRSPWEKRRDAFNALTRAEQIDMARFVLAHDPELADEVKEGYTPLFEAYHELQEVRRF